jgi:hypothetical protein
MHFTYKSRGLGRAKPGPSRDSRLWPGPGFEKAEAASGQAKAGAVRPSRAGTALSVRKPRQRGEEEGEMLMGPILCLSPTISKVLAY